MMEQEVVLPKIGTVLQFGTAGTVIRARVDSAAYASMGGLATAAVSMRVIVLSKCISCVETYMGHIEDMQAIYQGYMRVDAFSNCNSCVNTYAARVVSLGLV
jgi:hypothetical protein